MSSIGTLIGLLIIAIDTVSCNIAANLVGAAYDFSLIWPRRISYLRGGLITAAIGLFMMPWKILSTTNGYIFTWLAGYGALLGPIIGILIADYWLIRRRQLDVAGLYDPAGCYAYRSGWNPAAVIALVLALAPNLPGFLATAGPALFAFVPQPLVMLYGYAWFSGIVIAGGCYTLLMTRKVTVPAGMARPEGVSIH
jgi:NCS1 family nucleobase:cation symporter-1